MADTAGVDAGQGLPPRLRLVRILAWVMVAVAAVGLFGIVDLMTLPGWVDQRYIWAVSLEASWGSLMTFVVAGSFACNPRQPWPGAVLLAVAVLALLLGADVRLLPLAAVLGVPAGVLLWLARKHVHLLSTATKLSRPYLVLALAGLPLWLLHAAEGFSMSRREPDAGHITMGIEHWPVQGATCVVLAIAPLVLA